MRHVDRDLAPGAPTLFELAGPGLAALNVIGRGLPAADRLGRGAGFALRAARTHFSGNVAGWLRIDRDIGGAVAARVRAGRAAGAAPRVVFCALTGIDKTSHSAGHGAPVVAGAMRDRRRGGGRAARRRERGGWWAAPTVFVVSDHGHSPVRGTTTWPTGCARAGCARSRTRSRGRRGARPP
jgi:hypothetical protein